MKAGIPRKAARGWFARKRIRLGTSPNPSAKISRNCRRLYAPVRITRLDRGRFISGGLPTCFTAPTKPFGVGRRVSHGCVRLYPEDIERLYDSIKIGTPVTVIDQAMKIARIDDELWLEIHPNQKQSDEVEQTGKLSPAKPPEFEFRLVDAAGDAADRIDWDMAKQVARQRRGTPVQVLSQK